MTALVLILLLVLVVVFEMAAYRYARQELGMPRPWYWLIPGAGFVLLHRALRSEETKN